MQVNPVGGKLLDTKGEEQEAAKRDFLEMFKTLERELGEKPYFGGETFEFVDIALVTSYTHLQVFYERFCKFRMEAECPKIVAWFKRCRQKESVAKSLPDQKKISEFLSQWFELEE
jgi:glutathione S-transferase